LLNVLARNRSTSTPGAQLTLTFSELFAATLDSSRPRANHPVGVGLRPCNPSSGVKKKMPPPPPIGTLPGGHSAVICLGFVLSNGVVWSTSS